jgi:hypothetical protein
MSAAAVCAGRAKKHVVAELRREHMSRTAKPRVRPCAWMSRTRNWRRRHLARRSLSLLRLGQHSNCLDQSFQLRSSQRPATALFPNRLGERVWRCAAKCAIWHPFTKAEPEDSRWPLPVARQSGRQRLHLLDTLGERHSTTSRAHGQALSSAVLGPHAHAYASRCRRERAMRRETRSARHSNAFVHAGARGRMPFGPSQTAIRGSWKQTCSPLSVARRGVARAPV